MAGRKVWLRTSGLVDNYAVGDVVITRTGTEISSEGAAKEIESMAAAAGVPIARMDDAPEPTPEDEQVVRPDPGAGVVVNTDQEDGN